MVGVPIEDQVSRIEASRRTSTFGEHAPQAVQEASMGGWSNKSDYQGGLGELRIYDQALDAGEIDELFQMTGCAP